MGNKRTRGRWESLASLLVGVAAGCAAPEAVRGPSVVAHQEPEGATSCPSPPRVEGGYNLAQLPNSWEDAKILRPIIAKAWKTALAAK